CKPSSPPLPPLGRDSDPFPQPHVGLVAAPRTGPGDVRAAMPTGLHATPVSGQVAGTAHPAPLHLDGYDGLCQLEHCVARTDSRGTGGPGGLGAVGVVGHAGSTSVWPSTSRNMPTRSPAR